MAYTKQGFYSGDKLRASQLDAMEDGIISAETFASQALANTTAMEKGVGNITVQQPSRPDKVTQTSGETTPHFNFTGLSEAGMAGRIQYGAVGDYSTSMNGRSAALNKHAFAINNSTIAKGEESFAQGYETIAEGNSSSATGSRTWAKGVASHTEGLETITEADGAHAEGGETRAKAIYSHAEGYKTTANALYSHTEGSTTQTGGFSAHAEGNATMADSNASHTEGSGTKVVSYQLANTSGGGGGGNGTTDAPSNEDFTSVEDFRVRSSACAHAEGNNTISMGYSSHSEGVGTKAYGRASHAEGWCTETGELFQMEEGGQVYNIPNPEKGMAAHADGYNTKAIGNYSHASGFETVADRDAQTVVGMYNNTTSRDGSLFVVGAGSSDGGGRKNALEVISDGEIVIYWEGAYYSLNLILNLISNAHGGPSFFDLAKK